MKKYNIIIASGEVEVNEKRIRRCYLRVYPSGKIAASVPENYGREKTERFILSHIDWIYERLEQTKSMENKKTYYLGEEVNLDYNNIDKINAFFNSKKKEAYALFRSVMQSYLDKYPHFSPVPQLKIRSMVSWGLYNKRKNLITLNIKLIQADLEGIKMVIFHELCHILEQNHSKRFYALLSSEFPNYKIVKKKMKKYNTRF